MGCATVVSTTSASAPGYVAVSVTWGGTISGNWATGIWVMAMRPAGVMTREMTKASRGRSMKIAEITLSTPVVHHGQGGLDLLAGPDLLDAFHDHLFAQLQARLDDGVQALARPDRDPALFDLAIAVDDQNVITGLVDLQGRLGHDEAWLLLALA